MVFCTGVVFSDPDLMMPIPGKTMEFEVKKNVARGGSFVGAIFMSNRATKDECFIRRIFGLPASQTSFVKRVKMGMMLFLFEFEERKLYGVFEASSDGAINIAPSAFNSYGKFSAQTRFKIIWHCRPLSEPEFCEAIKDNYYTHNKFHFCLSDEQVHKLLLLFYEKRKTKIRSSFSFGTGNKAMKQYQNYDVSSLRVTVTNDRVDNEPRMDIDKEPVNLSRYSDSSRHYPSLSRYHKKSILNAEGSMGEGEQRFSSTVPCSSQPLTSDSMPSTSHKDGSVTGNLYASTLRSYGFPPGQSYFSSGVNHNNCTPVKEHVYSKSPASSLFPLSRRRLYPAHNEPDALNSSSTADYLSLEVTADYLSLEVTAEGDDCEALSFPDHFEPSGNDIPISGARYFDARRMCSSSFGCEGLSCSPSLSEHHDRPFLTCSPGNGTSRVHDCRHPSESQSEADYRERVSHHPPRHRDECYANVVNYGLRSDTFNKKTSVFSRLSLQDDGIYEPRADASVDELMGLLYQRRKSWRNTRKFRPWNNDKPLESVAPMENETSGFNAVEDDKDLEDNGEAAQEICESLILNFRRRSDVLKTKRGESDSRDHFEGRTQKRRKLMRPSFGKEEPFDGSAGKFLNMEALSFQELGEGSAEKSRGAVVRNTEGGDGKQTDSSQDDLEIVVSSTIVGIREEDGKVECISGHVKEDCNAVGLLQEELSKSVKNGNVQRISLESNINQASAEDISAGGLSFEVSPEEVGNKNTNLLVRNGEDGASVEKAKGPLSEEMSYEDAIPAVSSDDQASVRNIKGDGNAEVGDESADLPVYDGEAEGETKEAKQSLSEEFSNENVILPAGKDDQSSVGHVEGNGNAEVGHEKINLPVYNGKVEGKTSGEFGKKEALSLDDGLGEEAESEDYILLECD